MEEFYKELSSGLGVDFMDTKEILNIRATHPTLPIYAVVAVSNSNSDLLVYVTTDKVSAQKSISTGMKSFDISSNNLVLVKLKFCDNGLFVFERDNNLSYKYVYKQVVS